MNAQPLDPKKYHVLDKNKKYFLGMAAVMLILVLLPLAGLGYYKIAVNRGGPNTEPVNVEIVQGQGISSIATMLQNERVIHSEFLFKFFIYVNGLQQNMQAGVYTISPNTSIAELANVLQDGRNDRSITFLEGWRNEQFALEASESFKNIEYETFIQESENLQGMLFPDTYIFNSDISERDMIRVLNQTFEVKTSDILSEAALQEVQLEKDQVINLAAMVEREVTSSDDKTKVAGIIIKRFKEGTKLDIDATTQYIAAPLRANCDLSIQAICPSEQVARQMVWWPNNLTIAELENENPYNTRAVVGLPPQPIANPGLNSIMAVLNYDETQYYYYLTDSTGVTHYAETLDEHNQNIEQYLR